MPNDNTPNHEQPTDLQTPGGDSHQWLTLAHHGFGKSDPGGKLIRHWVMEKKLRRIALIGKTAMDVRQQLIEGEGGILESHENHERPILCSSNSLLRWPNGAQADVRFAKRGWNCISLEFDGAWFHDLEDFRNFHGYTNFQDMWEKVIIGMRRTMQAQILITVSPPLRKFIDYILTKPKMILAPDVENKTLPYIPPGFYEHLADQYKKLTLQ